ncbi:MAG TPA: efflux RND transporter periplasmic adaptor subunit [Chloroflexota bacterium]
MNRPRVIAGAAALGLVTAIAAACSTMPVPLPFQAQQQATPAAQATPGPGEPGKPQAQVPGKPGGQGAGVPVVVTPATTGKISASLTFSGAITPVQQTSLVPKTAGRIEKIMVDVGDQVKAGQPLVQLDHGSLDAAVKQAEANVQSAQARLSTVMAGARPEDVGAAQAQVNAARARLQGMLNGGRPEDIGGAQAAVDSAQAKLKQVQDGPKDGDVKAGEQQVQAAQAQFDAAVATLNKLKTPNPDELAQARAAVDKTQAALQQAQANYDKIGWRPDAAARPESVVLQQATADYQNALAQLRIKQQPREEDVATAQKQVDSARALLDANKTKLDQLKSGSTAEDLQIATSTLIQAQQTLQKARQPNTDTDIEQQRQQVAQLEQNLALKAQPFTDNDAQTARANLAQSQAALESAKVAALEGAILAPYDGIITARLLAEGSLTNATTPALSMASKDLEIVVNVEEARIGQVKAGQTATIAIPASPGKLFPAKVASIAPSADTRTHTFPVKVRPSPFDPQLMAGMFSEVKIVVADKDNIVVVPKDAVVQRSGKAVVYVVDNGRAKQVEIAGGVSDDKQVEVPSGIKAGDQIIVAGQATVNDGDPVRPGTVGGNGAAGGQGAPGKPQGGAPRPEGARSEATVPGPVGPASPAPAKQ